MGILGQRDEFIAGKWLRFTIFQYDAGSTTFVTDPTAMGGSAPAKVFHLEGGTDPTASIAATSSTVATVTVATGSYGKVLVITMHGDSVGGVH